MDFLTPLTTIYYWLKRKFTPEYKLVVCIYTCEKHRELLHQFHKSALGQYLRKLPDTKILEVYANPDIHHSTLHKNELTLRTEERYETLSLKTHKMLDYCVHNFDFQHLLKIDVSTVMDHFEGPEYKDRKPINLHKLIFFLKNAPCEKDYDGFIHHAHATRKNAENWAAKKGVTINYEKLFGDSQQLPPFFSGKCYIVSQRFAQYVSEYGQEMAEEHKKYFLGAEDLMVGRMHDRFKEFML